MKAWQGEYQRKLTTAAEAVKAVKSGDRLILSHACGEPRVLPAELLKRAGELGEIQIVHQVPMGEALYCRPEYARCFRHIALFAGAPSQEDRAGEDESHHPHRPPGLPGAFNPESLRDLPRQSLALSP